MTLDPEAGPLAGIRVIDFTRLLPGPVATFVLADLGADVIKVEETSLSRAGGARDVLSGRDPETDAELRPFNAVARNKRSLSVDFRTEAGSAIVRQLAERSDVLIQGYRPGVLSRFGLGYDELHAVNLRLIYCSISGFGDSGPYKNRAGHDANYASTGGVTSITSDLDGRPVWTGVPVMDFTSGYWSVIGILAALHEREKSGLGQHISVPMLGAAVHLSTTFLSRYFRDGRVPRRGRANITVLETADGRYLVTQNGEEHFWRAFCEGIGRPDFIARRRGSYQETKAMYDEIRAIIKTRTRDEWMEVFRNRDVCVTALLEIDEVPLDPQVQHLGLVQEVPHEKYGAVRQVGFPIHMSRSPWKFRNFAPALGENNEDILLELGYQEGEIRSLYEAGTLARADY